MIQHDCSDCGRPARTGGRQCARCYQRRYRATERGRRAHNDAVIRYNKAHPERRRRWVRAYRERIGWYVPDLTELRRAIKAIDRAVAEAEKRA